MDVKLSEGAIAALTKGSHVTNPLLQVVNIRRITGPPVRYRLMMSDGRHSHSSFMLAGQLNFLVEENRVAIHCVCKLKKTVTNVLGNGRQVVIVLDMDVVWSAEEIGAKIGTTTPYVEGPTTPPQKARLSTPTPPQGPAPTTTHSSPGGQYKSLQTAGPRTPTHLNTRTPTHSYPAGPTASPQKAGPSTLTPPQGPAPTATHSSPGGQYKSLQTAGPSTPTHSYPAAASPSPGRGRGRGHGSRKKTPAVSPSSPGDHKMVPIASLNPYQTKWTIRARVTNKSAVRTWSNSKGQGKLFSFEIVDESGEIRITAFNKEVDKFFSLVEAGKVYYISRGTLKIANKQYNTLKNDYEMSLHTDTTIVPCDDSPDVPVVHCNFVPIADLEHRDKDAIVDVIGVCRGVGDVSRIVTKSSRETSKRDLHLLDASGKEVTVTLWGDQAEQFDGSSGRSVVAIKGARLSDFGGRSLSALFSSTVMVNPDLPEAFTLRSWYDQEGHAMDSQSLSGLRSGGSRSNTNWKTLRDAGTERLGQGDKAEYFSCVATVLYSRKESCLYPSCPSDGCFKKVVDQMNGLYRCEKCDRDFPNFNYRLILSANIADFGDNQWVTCFQETAEALLGNSAETLGQLRDTDEAAFDEVFQKAAYTTHVFRLRVKMETYNDEARLKASVMDVAPVDHREFSRRLISSIRRTAASSGGRGAGVRRQLWKTAPLS